MPRTIRWFPTVLALALFLGCGGSPEPEPGRDSGAGPDARGPDAGFLDATVPGADAAAPGEDAGAAVDAGRALDAFVARDASGPDTGLAALCPPAAPFGTAVGDVSADMTFLDCDGNTHTLHELCETRVVWLFEFADWCPPCRSFAMSMANAVYDANRSAHPGEFEAWMVISETASFGVPTAGTCAAVRDRYGVHMPVLIDPTGSLQSALGVPANEIQVVLDRGARIRWVGHYAAAEVAGQIDAAFAR